MKITREYYKLNPKYCRYCNKQLTFEQRHGLFCCKSCACTYNNLQRGPMSDCTKHKISDGVKTSIKTKVRKQKQKKLRKTICPICNKIFYYKPQHKRKTCSEECLKKLMSLNSKLSVEKRIKDGTFQGWKTRNIISYSENFFINVLNNNNIKYIREYVVNIDNNHRYFLDFLININNRLIDLEIDGKQHTYKDRKQHDIIRDEELKKLGYEIYRIPWNEINSDLGKVTMKLKIDDLLKFLYK